MSKRHTVSKFTPFSDELFEVAHEAVKAKLLEYIWEYNGNTSLMAECLYTDRSNLCRMLKKYEIDVVAIREMCKRFEGAA